MKNSSYFRLSGLLFLIVFVLHLVRLIRGWEVVVDGVVVPMWISWIAVVLLGILAYSGLKGIKNN